MINIVKACQSRESEDNGFLVSRHIKLEVRYNQLWMKMGRGCRLKTEYLEATGVVVLEAGAAS
jgi:hypothetical protein